MCSLSPWHPVPANVEFVSCCSDVVQLVLWEVILHLPNMFALYMYVHTASTAVHICSTGCGAIVGCCDVTNLLCVWNVCEWFLFWFVPNVQYGRKCWKCCHGNTSPTSHCESHVMHTHIYHRLFFIMCTVSLQ